MQASLRDFCAYLIPHDPLLQPLDAVNGLVTGMTVRQPGQVRISCLLAQPLPPDLLDRLEQRLEKALPAREVIFGQRFARPLAPDVSSRYAVSLAPWLLRHLWKKDAFLASLLRHAEFSASANQVSVAVQAACFPHLPTDALAQLADLYADHIEGPAVFRLVPQTGDLADYVRQLDDQNLYQANQARASILADRDPAARPSAGDPPPRPGQQAGRPVQPQPGSSVSPSGQPGQAAQPSGPARPSGSPDRPARRPSSPARPSGSVAGGRPYRRAPKPEGVIWGKINPELRRSAIADVNSESGLVLLEGTVFALESREVSNGTRLLYKFALTDLTNSVTCVLFARPEDRETLDKKLPDAYIRVNAEISFDSQYSKDLQARVLGLQTAVRQPGRQDQAAVRRVELHCHTKMSTKDAICEAADVVRLAASFGHPAVAITDHGVVQSFPDACNAQQTLAAKGQTIKVIYGMEGYLVDDGLTVAWEADDATLDQGFVALDVETTGLEPALDRVIEIAAIRFLPDGAGGFVQADRLVTFVNPGIPVPARITELTGITTEMLSGAPASLAAMQQLADFLGDSPVIAHNAFFDLAFLRYEGFRIAQESDPRIKFNPPLVDTLALARLLLPDLANHKLKTVAAHLNVALENHHRADADALACGRIFAVLLRQSAAASLAGLNALAGHLTDDEIRGHRRPVYHIILLAQDNLGLYNLYRLISLSHTRYFHTRPRIPRALLQYYRSGLILGSACEAGEVFQAVLAAYRDSAAALPAARERLQKPDMIRLVRFYDYLEIQPTGNNRFLLRQADSGVATEEDLRNLNRLIVELGQQIRKPVCATCDVHFLEQRDAEFRRILLDDMGYDDADQQPDIFFRTTDEMLAEFAYLGETPARQLVIDNPTAIADRVNPAMKPFPDGSFPPIIASAADDVRQLTWQTALDLYGRDGQLPELVQQRIERELQSIIDNGFAVMYYIAHHLVKKSNDDGYIVGSRGSVGSSLVATLCGITEVNPLPPHYYCPSCRLSEFDESGNYGSGYDLPARDCPDCGTPLVREGQDIPFETFLGFNGDKQPDIDLNFSSEYQTRAHKFIEEMFGSTHTFRAGTIGSYADKNAQAIVRNYFEKQNRFATQAEINRLSQGLIGVKRTTGQHPGGIVVVPRERDVYDFTPIQHPADKRDGGTITTHFDFNAMHDTILKLDVLGHDDPTMLKMLGDLTGIDVRTIPIPDARVMALFQSTEPIGIPEGSSPAGSATLGLPELGTFMARDMIQETRPSSFFDLVQLMGLSHGTDVWKGNAQDLIRGGICTINNVIGCRDSIMTWLIYNGLPPKASFDIMEKVRKGKGLSADHETLMRDHGVPEWYIDSCQKIKYMFPKAHAAAYTISSLRIAWFKVYHPAAYYCAYFTVRADEFDSNLMCQPAARVSASRADLRGRFRDLTDREQRIYYIIELVEEMQLRGIDFLPISLYASAATKFAAEAANRIRPPLNAIPGISAAIAEAIIAARAAGPFISRDDLMRRAGIGQGAIDTLVAAGCLGDLPVSAQLDLFSLLG